MRVWQVCGRKLSPPNLPPSPSPSAPCSSVTGCVDHARPSKRRRLTTVTIISVRPALTEQDVISLFAIGSVNACMCLFGLLHERMNAGKPPSDVNWEAFWCASLL